MQFHCLDYKQTTQETKKNKNKSIKYKNKRPFNQHNSKKHQNCRENSFSIDWKQNKKQDKNKTKTKKT